MQKKKNPTPAELESSRKRVLENTIAQIEKAHGKGAIMTLGSQEILDIPVVSTGCIQLDMALGIGGYPKGKIVEIYGPEASGKTTLTLHAIAEAQKAGGVAAFIDAEHAFDPVYARKLGIDIDNLLVAQPDSGEQALDICETLVRSGAIDMVVIDSVAALVPRAEINGDMGDSHMGLQARLMSQALRKLTGVVNRSHTCLFFTNQLRMKLGVMFGNPETTSGGNALKFYASVRLDIRRIATIKEADVAIGNRTRVKVVKNKTAAPFKQCEFDIIYGSGISKQGSLLDMATEYEIVQKSGTWFSYGKERLGQGRDRAVTFLKENPETALEIEAKIRDTLTSKEDDDELLANIELVAQQKRS
jgi:recombination protein RecA